MTVCDALSQKMCRVLGESVLSVRCSPIVCCAVMDPSMSRDHVHPTRLRAESHLVRSAFVRRRRPLQRLSLNGADANEPPTALEDAS